MLVYIVGSRSFPEKSTEEFFLVRQEAEGKAYQLNQDLHGSYFNVYPRELVALPSSELVMFFRNQVPCSSGDYVTDLIESTSWNELEEVHNYIQWLFPTKSKSVFQPLAPTLSKFDIKLWKSDEELRKVSLSALNLMSNFYLGNRRWITPKNHNYMRITRILQSLTTLGMKEEAEDFLDMLKKLPTASLEVIGKVSMAFWEFLWLSGRRH